MCGFPVCHRPDPTASAKRGQLKGSRGSDDQDPDDQDPDDPPPRKCTSAKKQPTPSRT